jgi:hypothetical protein
LTASEHLIQQNVQEKHPAAHLKSIFKREGTPLENRRNRMMELNCQGCVCA